MSVTPTSPSPPSPSISPTIPPIAILCHHAHALRRPHLLAAHAQTYITQHPASVRAWTYLALALHTLRRYTHAIPVFQTAITLSYLRSPDNLATLRLLLRIARLLATLHISPAPVPSPTALLHSDWYRTTLNTLFHSATLVYFPPFASLLPPFPAPNRPSPAPPISLSTCAIVLRTSGKYNQEYKEVPDRAGGNRSYPPSLLSGFPLDQTTGGYLFLKDRIASLGCDCYDETIAPCEECHGQDLPAPVAAFPKLPLALPASTQILGGPLRAIHVATGLISPNIHHLLVEKLANLAAHRKDSPVKNYQNIIDPNIAAVNGRWVPTEFTVDKLPTRDALQPLHRAFHRHTRTPLPTDIFDHIHTLSGNPTYATATLRSAIPDLDPHKHAPLHLAVQHVLSAALPLLANLQLPALLLPGPLQVVVKAQSIVLDEGEHYAGVWHEDGLREHVVAIVLYYYGISPSLSGGDMEFASKIRSPMWYGDGGGPYEFDVPGVRSAIDDLAIKAPVQQGTMLVFSNYALIHRVLPMVAKGAAGSRDFLALFVIDQKHPLPVPDDLGPRKERIRKRSELLCEQLQERGHFGMDGSEVYTTGNGTYSDLAWIRSGHTFPMQSDMYLYDAEDDEILSIVSRLNMLPPVIGRGSSFLSELDMPIVQFNATSAHVLHVIEGQRTIQVFVNTARHEYMSTEKRPSDGIREVRVFDSVQEWLDQGLWSNDGNLVETINSVGEKENLQSRENPEIAG